MNRPHLPLNALRAFEASALHLSFTRAAIELCVTQAAVSHQVKNDGLQLGVPLFRRPPRDLMVTEEGWAPLPMAPDSFDRIGETLRVARRGICAQCSRLAHSAPLQSDGYCRGCQPCVARRYVWADIAAVVQQRRMAEMFTAAMPKGPDALRGMALDSSLAMTEAALRGAGGALALQLMLAGLLASGEIVQPRAIPGRRWPMADRER